MTDCDLAFLSEPQAFTHDLPQLLRHFRPQYNYFLNSEDIYDDELAMVKNKTFGGTLILWKTNLDAYISVHPVSTTSFLPIVLQPPGVQTSVHICLYLPTSGLETQFLEQLILLQLTIEELSDKYAECLIYLRGDANVNSKNKTRHRLFQNFLKSLQLHRIAINHNTYHHFIGEGLFDSEIDVIIQPGHVEANERIKYVFCVDD